MKSCSYLRIVQDPARWRVGRTILTLGMRVARMQKVLDVLGPVDLRDPDYYELFALLGHAASHDRLHLPLKPDERLHVITHRLRNKMHLLLCLESILRPCPVKDMLCDLNGKMMRFLP